MIAVDTNVLVYTADRSEPGKQKCAAELLTRLAAKPEQTVLMWQVACEFLNWLRRRERSGELNSDEVQHGFEHVTSLFPVALPTPDVFGRSFELRAQRSLSHWDSLLLAACIEANVETLYSEDMGDGETYGTVTVLNPFA